MFFVGDSLCRHTRCSTQAAVQLCFTEPTIDNSEFFADIYTYIHTYKQAP